MRQIRPTADEGELRAVLREIEAEYELSTDQAFAYWFIQAMLTGSDYDARQCLSGASHDKGIDAVYIDLEARRAYLMQLKYRKKATASEDRDKVLGLLEKARIVFADRHTQNVFKKRLSQGAASRYEALIRKVHHDDFGLELMYVTTGSVSESIKMDLDSQAREIRKAVTTTVIDAAAINSLFKSYIHGVAPAVQVLELAIADSESEQAEHYLMRVDQKSKVESWLFAMTAEDVGRLYADIGDRLFARNIRGYLGEGKINRAIADTLHKEPENFWYYNNGLTIICDGAQLVDGKLEVKAPQVINGQQTTRALAGTHARSASVLVKVIAVPKDTGDLHSGYESMVTSIVRATNWQNAIKASDLVANDSVQITIERELAKLGYRYLRKRESKTAIAAKNKNNIPPSRLIKKEELAQALAACDLRDSAVVLAGTEALFGELYYKKVFKSTKTGYILQRYWAMRQVKSASRGKPTFAYAKWLVLHHLHSLLNECLKSGMAQRQFRHASEKKVPEICLTHLGKAIKVLYAAAMAFYKINAKVDHSTIDRQSFFKKKGLDETFLAYVKRDAATLRKLDTHLEAFRKRLAEVEIP